MGTSYTAHLYFGAPIDKSVWDDAWEDEKAPQMPGWLGGEEHFDANGDSDEDFEDVLARLQGWSYVEYIDEDLDPEGHQRWSKCIDERIRLNKLSGIELGWSGHLEWDESEREHFLFIRDVGKDSYDGASINVGEVTEVQFDPDWEPRLREWAQKLGITLREPVGWYATMSAG